MLFLEQSYNRIQSWCVQALGVYQHTLQSFKNTFLNRNLDKICLRMLYFYDKSWKNRRSVGSSTPNPLLASGGWGGPDLQVDTLTRLTSYFWALLRFLGIVKITTYHLILGRVVGPLAKLAPLAQASSGRGSLGKRWFTPWILSTPSFFPVDMHWFVYTFFFIRTSKFWVEDRCS